MNMVRNGYQIMDTINSQVKNANARKTSEGKLPVKSPRAPQSRREAAHNKVVAKRHFIDTDFYVSVAINMLEDVRKHHEQMLRDSSQFHLFRDSVRKEYERDKAEMLRRVSSEGLSFLTKTLPALGKAIDKALAKDAPFESSGFEIDTRVGLPRFLGQLTQMIFTTSSEGSFPCLPLYSTDYSVVPPALLERGTRCKVDISLDMSTLALKLMRQICYAFYKLNVPYDEKAKTEVINTFVETDSSCPEEIRDIGEPGSHIISMARGLISRVLCSYDPAEVYPRHGPGAVSTGEKPQDKAKFKRFYTRLNAFYPYDVYFFYNHSHLSDRLQELADMEVLEAGTAKVVLVPKDSRGPRLISCEPLELQWIQQGQMKALMDCIESHPFTKGRVNFRSQDVNRHLALSSSLPNEDDMVTLDLKEASDRVSLALVRELFPTRWYDALYASRSSHTKLPNGHLVPLKKFAPMGSATCFPVEALIFWALGVATLAAKRGCSADSIAHRGSRFLKEQFYVFGDDIICSSEIAVDYKHTLELVGLMLNDAKCCVKGLFRESCGCDAFAGVDVTPAKFRRTWDRHCSVDSYPSWVAYSNLLWEKGFSGTADWLLERIQSVRLTPVTSTEDSRPGCVAFLRPQGRYAYRDYNSALRRRFSPSIQCFEYLCTCIETLRVTGSHDGWEEMLRLRSYQGPSKDLPDARLDKLSAPNILYLEADQYSVRRRAKLKRRWMPLP